jgi:hypothetical protein
VNKIKAANQKLKDERAKASLKTKKIEEKKKATETKLKGKSDEVKKLKDALRLFRHRQPTHQISRRWKELQKEANFRIKDEEMDKLMTECHGTQTLQRVVLHGVPTQVQTHRGVLNGDLRNGGLQKIVVFRGLSSPLPPQNPLEKLGGFAPPSPVGFAVGGGRLDPQNRRFSEDPH